MKKHKYNYKTIDVKITDDGYGIHTAELSCFVSSEVYYSMLENSKTKTYTDNTGTKYKLLDLDTVGINVMLRSVYNNGYKRFFVSTILNLYQLLCTDNKIDNPIAIYGQTSKNTLPLSYLSIVFDSIMKNNGYPIRYSDMKLRRVDLCVNFYTTNKEVSFIFEYTKLMASTPTVHHGANTLKRVTNQDAIEKLKARKGNNSKMIKRLQDMDKNQVRYDGGDYSIAIYDKYRQCKALGISTDTIPKKYKSRNILRCEMMLYRNRIRKLSDNDNVSDSLDDIYNIIKKTMLKFYRKCFGDGKYVTKEYLLGVISESIKSEELKLSMQEYVELIMRYRTRVYRLVPIIKRPISQEFIILGLYPNTMLGNQRTTELPGIISLLDMENHVLDVSRRPFINKETIAA